MSNHRPLKSADNEIDLPKIIDDAEYFIHAFDRRSGKQIDVIAVVATSNAVVYGYIVRSIFHKAIGLPWEQPAAYIQENMGAMFLLSTSPLPFKRK